MENLSVKLRSMRTTSSLTFVGGELPPMNWAPLVGRGKMPALRSEDALGAIMQAGILFPGNGCPGVIPAGGVPPGQFAPRPTTPVGTLIVSGFPFGSVDGNTDPVPGPFASGYSLASGTV